MHKLNAFMELFLSMDKPEKDYVHSYVSAFIALQKAQKDMERASENMNKKDDSSIRKEVYEFLRENLHFKHNNFRSIAKDFIDRKDTDFINLITKYIEGVKLVRNRHGVGLGEAREKFHEYTREFLNEHLSVS